MKQEQTPTIKDLVLIGGGHAHVSVLRRFGMRPMPGVRITLIARDIHAPYSGMLPGLVAGHYGFDECHIDLGPLARFADARLYHAAVEGVDLERKLLAVRGRPPVRFDVLSINIGSRPAFADVQGAREFAVPLKPIDRWLAYWPDLQARVLAVAEEAFRIVVVGGGAGGVEMALAMQCRLHRCMDEAGIERGRLRVAVVTREVQILASHNRSVRARFERICRQRDIELVTGRQVTAVSRDAVHIADDALAADAIVWATHAAAPTWPNVSGLRTDADGFIAVNRSLQSLSHADVFAAGDIASLPDARPKSGVFAVRQGPVLADNLRRRLRARPLRKYRPQRDFLGLISSGDQYAVASRGRWSFEGGWLWRWKDRIDRRFMRRFNELPSMPDVSRSQYADGLADRDAIDELSTLAMRCGGCGAKVGSGVLERVLRRLPQTDADKVLVGLGDIDDASVFDVPQGRVLVQSVDYFRAFVDDPYLLGRIAANHALGDLYAMGAEAHSALAVATVPYGIERMVEQTLFELMTGALEVLQAAGAVLAGGHSGEGAELAFGLVVNGLAEPGELLRKRGLRRGDALILSKPVGTGTLLAADMRGRARGRWISAAATSMQVSAREAMHCLRAHGATACTDITGFGLVGHLLEMARASRVGARVDMASVPLLDGALSTAAAGILSTLQPHNLRLRRAVRDVDTASRHPAYALMFDPQTAGGLLAGVAAQRADDCVAALHDRGYNSAAVIGEVVADDVEDGEIDLR